MTRQEVMERFCALSAKVGRVKFNHMKSCDCFCGNTDKGMVYSFDESIIEFIEEAVDKKLGERV